MLILFFISTLLTAQNNFSSHLPLDLTSCQTNRHNITLRFKLDPSVTNPDIKLGQPLHHKTTDGRKISPHAVLSIELNGHKYFTYANNPDCRSDTAQTTLRYDPRSHVLLAIIPRKDHKR